MVQKYLNWIRQELAINSDEDYYHVATQHIIALYGESLLAKYGSVMTLFGAFIPNLDIRSEKVWENWEKGLKSQRLLFRLLQKLFFDETILFNYTHPVLFSSRSLSSLISLFVTYIAHACFSVSTVENFLTWN